MMPVSAKGIGKMDQTTNLMGTVDKKNEKHNDSFSALLTLNTNADVQDTTSYDAYKVNNFERTSKKSDYDYQDKFNNNSGKNNIDKKSNDIDVSVKGEVQDEKAYDIEEAADIDDTLLEILQGIQQIIMDKYDVNEVEIENALQELNIGMADLLDETSLKDFVMQIQDIEKVDLLIDENIASEVELDVELIQASIEELQGNVELLEKNMTLDEELDLENIENFDVASENSITTSNKENIAVKVDIESDMDKDMMQSENRDANIIQSINNAIIDNTIVNEIDTENFDFEVDNVDIVKQIVDEVKVNITREVTSMELQLNPESLGRVHINVENRNGVMQARIVAETEAAKNAIESGLSTLKDTFLNQELKVDSIEVMVAPHSFFEESQNNDNQDSNERSQSTSSTRIEDVSDVIEDENDIEEEIMRTQGNTVSYLA